MRDPVFRTVLLAAIVAIAPASRAQDAAKSAPPATREAPPAPAAESPTAAPVDSGAGKAAAATPPGSRPPPPPTQQRFTPSEKVRADFPISFPIDI